MVPASRADTNQELQRGETGCAAVIQGFVRNEHKEPTPMLKLRVPIILLLLGGVAIGLYASHVGKLGEPSDIGGGLVVIAGYMLTAAGLVLLSVTLWQRHKRLRSSGRE